MPSNDDFRQMFGLNLPKPQQRETGRVAGFSNEQFRSMLAGIATPTGPPASRAPAAPATAAPVATAAALWAEPPLEPALRPRLPGGLAVVRLLPVLVRASPSLEAAHEAFLLTRSDAEQDMLTDEIVACGENDVGRDAELASQLRAMLCATPHVTIAGLHGRAARLNGLEGRVDGPAIVGGRVPVRVGDECVEVRLQNLRPPGWSAADCRPPTPVTVAAARASIVVVSQSPSLDGEDGDVARAYELSGSHLSVDGCRSMAAGYSLSSAHLSLTSRLVAVNPLLDAWSQTDRMPQLCHTYQRMSKVSGKAARHMTLADCGRPKCRLNHSAPHMPDSVITRARDWDARRGDFAPLSLAKAVLDASGVLSPGVDEYALMLKHARLAVWRQKAEWEGAGWPPERHVLWQHAHVSLLHAQLAAALLARLAERWQRPGSAPPPDEERRALLEAAAHLQDRGLLCEVCGRHLEACCFWPLTAHAGIAPGGRRLLSCVGCARREGFWLVGDGQSKRGRTQCTFFDAGCCREGSRCTFLHAGAQSAPPPPPPCGPIWRPSPAPSRVRTVHLPTEVARQLQCSVVDVTELAKNLCDRPRVEPGRELLRLLGKHGLPNGAMLLRVDGVWVRSERMVRALLAAVRARGHGGVEVDFYERATVHATVHAKASPSAPKAAEGGSSSPATPNLPAAAARPSPPPPPPPAAGPSPNGQQPPPAALASPRLPVVEAYALQMQMNTRMLMQRQMSFADEAPSPCYPAATLTAECEALVLALQPPAGDAEARAAIIARLERNAQTVARGARLHLYGSSACDLAAEGADLDLTLVTPRPSTHSEQVAIVTDLALILGSRPGWCEIEGVTRARVPLVRCVDTSSGFPCDVSIDNNLARVKTMLLGAYSRCEPRCRSLIFVVKRWAKRRALNEPRSGFPNSYTWCVLVIAYLQSTRPPVLPVLTSLRGGPWASAWADDPLGVLPAVDDAAGGDAAASEDADWRATREELRADLAAVLGAAAVAGAAQPNRESLGQLLLGFFGHWNRWIGGDEGGDGRNRIGAGKRGLDCSAERLVVCTRLGGPLAQKAKRWPANAVGEDFHLWPIEDPVDTSHDLGRIVTPRSLEVLRQELGAAVSKLDDGWALERVLEEHQAA